MIFDFSINQQVKISMVEYVKEIITTWDNTPKPNDKDFKLAKSKQVKKGKACAAPEDLFRIDENATKLNAEQIMAFYNIVA